MHPSSLLSSVRLFPLYCSHALSSRYQRARAGEGDDAPTRLQGNDHHAGPDTCRERKSALSLEQLYHGNNHPCPSHIQGGAANLWYRLHPPSRTPTGCDTLSIRKHAECDVTARRTTRGARRKEAGEKSWGTRAQTVAPTARSPRGTPRTASTRRNHWVTPLYAGGMRAERHKPSSKQGAS